MPWSSLGPAQAGRLALRRELFHLTLAQAATTLAQAALPVVLRILFLLYPLVTTIAFEAFSCYTFDGDDTTRAFLVGDVAIECSTADAVSAEQEAVKAVAWFAIVLYPVGVLGLFAALLLAARKAILLKQPTPLSSATSFLHREYSPDFYWRAHAT